MSSSKNAIVGVKLRSVLILVFPRGTELLRLWSGQRRIRFQRPCALPDEGILLFLN
ncbi:MAG TPA: hypothetical protein VMW43_03420 [Bacteroidota bacterium]|nr:hypothetical protein [Bacteroidota bacterium]